METPKANVPPSIVPVPLVGPQAASPSPPWLEDDTIPLMVARAPAPRQPLPAAPSLPPAQAVHWSIVVLTLVTAASVLLGSYGGGVSRPRELLPVMIVTPAR
jgi:hypothetical protein